VKEASYKIAALAANTNKPHTVRLTLLMPACIQIAKIIQDLEAAKKMS
jgi:hypothetical protein